jgi:hypothetical protein
VDVRTRLISLRFVCKFVPIRSLGRLHLYGSTQLKRQDYVEDAAFAGGAFYGDMAAVFIDYF